MLVEALYEEYVFINKVTVNDSEGSVVATYVEGAKFMATKKPDKTVTSAIKNIGQKSVAMPSWQIAVPDPVRLNHGDIIKHVKSGQVYRVTGNDFKAAKIATYKFNVAIVEEWELPNE